MANNRQSLSSELSKWTDNLTAEFQRTLKDEPMPILSNPPQKLKKKKTHFMNPSFP